MNPMLIFVALAVAGFSWSLIRGLSRGAFIFGNGSYGRTIAHVERAGSPIAFWLIVAFHVGLIVHVASLAFEM